MPNTVLGKVSCVPRGDYNAGTTYYALDIVGYQGGSYLAMKEVTGVTPSNDQVNWMQLSSPGLPGEQGEKGDPGTAAGFGEATATVDETTGTPSVEVETSGPDTAKVFSFSFSGLKGETGAKGDTGDQGIQGIPGVAAGFGTPTATVDDSVGTPGVTVQASGPDTAKVFSFAFVNLKGETGAQGIQGEKGDPGTSVQSIQRTSGTGAAGTTDTYTMYDSDGGEIGTFTVYNGTNGTGAGDFMSDGSVPMTGNLDMNGNRVTEVGTPTADTDAANKAYVDDALEGVTITTDATPTEDSANPVQSGGVFDALSNKQDTLSGTEDQLVGFNSAGEATAVSKPTATDVGAMPAVSGGTAGQVLTKTEAGQEWQNAPDGLPSGGEEGQVLTKTASGAQWDDVPSDLPSGGTDGQILTKTADGVAWEDAPEGGVTSFNSRTGAITPQTGDYTAEMVGAVSEEDVGVANGVAELDSTGKVPASQLPSMDYIPTSEKGANSGVATLDASGKLTATQKPTYTADEVGARPNTWTPTASDVGAVPTSRTVNGKALSSNITLNASDVGARANNWTPTASEVGAVPTSRTVNGKPLSSNISLTADDVGAANPPTLRTATLTAAGWSSNTQTVTVSGVLANETAQLIQPMPAVASQAAYYAAGILCMNQAANSLTFTCQTVPTEDLTVYVVIQEVTA